MNNKLVQGGNVGPHTWNNNIIVCSSAREEAHIWAPLQDNTNVKYYRLQLKSLESISHLE